MFSFIIVANYMYLFYWEGLSMSYYFFSMYWLYLDIVYETTIIDIHQYTI